jgi:GDPmannose 4,6-dehydratase
MWLMLQQEQPDYVITTGETHSIREFLDLSFSYVHLNWEDYISFDERYLRPAEVNILLGGTTKAKIKLEWESSVTFEELVHLIVEADLAFPLGLCRPNGNAKNQTLPIMFIFVDLQA